MQKFLSSMKITVAKYQLTPIAKVTTHCSPMFPKKGKLVVKADSFHDYSDSYFGSYAANDRKINNPKLDYNYFIIKGLVSDFVTTKPIKDAEITFLYENGLKSETVKTTSDGTFLIRPLNDKKGSLQIAKDGYITITDNYSPKSPGQICQGGNFNYKIRPANETWNINGRILDNTSSTPISQAKISFIYEDGSPSVTGEVDIDGYFNVKPAINKKGGIVIEAPNYITLKDFYNPRGSGLDTYNYTYRLTHNYWTAKGTIVDSKTLEPVVDANISFSYKESEKEPVTCKTNSKGQYQLLLDIDKPGTIEITKEGWVTVNDSFGMRGGDKIETWNYEIEKNIKK